MIKINSNCTACGACSEVCPTKCIELSIDDYGFLYPKIDLEKCINCGSCNKVCHLNQTHIRNSIVKAYAVKSNSDSVINRSTSGGAFSALADYVLDSHGTVYGCSYINHLKAQHIRIDNKDDLHRINGSKYVQSDIKDCFNMVKSDLKSYRLVLFSGTPCQVAALNSFLGKEKENLITVDLICHGVCSQSFFDKYIAWYEQRNNCHLLDYNFRSKSNCGWSLAGEATGICANSNKQYRNKIYYYNEFYYFFFLKGLTYRASCYSCKYANLRRPGDITLGDMWGAEKLNLKFRTDDGCSLYIANTQKGSKLLSNLDVNSSEINIEEATRVNLQLVKPSVKPFEYEYIIRFITQASAAKIDTMFRSKYRIERIKGFIKYHFPTRLKRVIKRIL